MLSKEIYQNQEKIKKTDKIKRTEIFTFFKIFRAQKSDNTENKHLSSFLAYW